MISVFPPEEQGSQTVVIGKSQGYLGLAVNYSVTIDEPTGRETPCLRTAYQPTPKELEALNAGASIIVELINVTQHPPIAVYTGPIPD